MVPRSLGILAAVGALLVVQGAAAQPAAAVSATSGSSGGAYDPGDEEPTCALWDSRSFSKNITAGLYADDEEQSFDSETERNQWIRDNCGFEPPVQGIGTDRSPFQSDRSYGAPPGRLTSQLNREQFRNASFRYGYYPSPDEEGPLRINYGQARVFAIENATRIHTGNGTTKMAIPEEGTLYGMFHFNTTDRTYTYPPYRDPFYIGGNLTEYNITGGYRVGGPIGGDPITSEYVTACVAVNGGNCSGSTDATTSIRSENTNRNWGRLGCPSRTCNKSGKIAIDYDISDYDNVENVTFRVKINQTFEEEFYECKSFRRSICYDENGSRRNGAWSLQDEDIYSRNSTLTQTVEIAESRPQANIEIAVFPDGSREFRISNASGVRAIQFSDGADQRGLPDAVEYQYRYFSAGDSSWDGLEHQPVVMHAYPARVYDPFPAWDPPIVIAEAYGDTRGFTLPANVDVERASRFVELDELIVGEVDSFSESEVRLYGIPPGTTASFDDIDTSTRQVKKTNLSAEVVGGNQTHAVIELELVDADGNPIYTGNRPGVIFVDGRKVDTNPNGKVTVVQRRLGGVRAQYRPTPWYKLPRSTQAYTASQDRAYPGVGRGLLNFILYLIKRTAPLWGAVLVGLYLVDKLPDADTWPPWKMIR